MNCQVLFLRQLFVDSLWSDNAKSDDKQYFLFRISPQQIWGGRGEEGKQLEKVSRRYNSSNWSIAHSTSTVDSPKSPKTVIRVNWATFLDVSHNIETITSFGISDGVMMVVFGNIDDDHNARDDDEERHLCGGSLPRGRWMKYYAGLGTINQNAFQMEPLAKDHGL